MQMVRWLEGRQDRAWAVENRQPGLARVYAPGPWQDKAAAHVERLRAFKACQSLPVDVCIRYIYDDPVQFQFDPAKALANRESTAFRSRTRKAYLLIHWLFIAPIRMPKVKSGSSPSSWAAQASC